MTDGRSLRIFAIEDEALLLMNLQALVTAAGHTLAASAMSSQEAMTIGGDVEADLAFVDLHLADGETGLAVGRYLSQVAQIPVVFVTADQRSIPALMSEAEDAIRVSCANDAGGDYAGAVGIIAKPYTRQGLDRALAYLADGLQRRGACGPRPPNLFITPAYAAQWSVPASAGP